MAEDVVHGAGSIIGLAVGAIVGGAAALGWILWIWLAFGGATSEATGHGPVVTSEAEPVDRAACGGYRGAKWRLVVAGSTSCPGTCPPAVASNAAALRELAPRPTSCGRS